MHENASKLEDNKTILDNSNRRASANIPDFGRFAWRSKRHSFHSAVKTAVSSWNGNASKKIRVHRVSSAYSFPDLQMLQVTGLTAYHDHSEPDSADHRRRDQDWRHDGKYGWPPYRSQLHRIALNRAAGNIDSRPAGVRSAMIHVGGTCATTLVCGGRAPRPQVRCKCAALAACGYGGWHFTVFPLLPWGTGLTEDAVKGEGAHGLSEQVDLVARVDADHSVCRGRTLTGVRRSHTDKDADVVGRVCHGRLLHVLQNLKRNHVSKTFKLPNRRSVRNTTWKRRRIRRDVEGMRKRLPTETQNVCRLLFLLPALVPSLSTPTPTFNSSLLNITRPLRRPFSSSVCFPCSLVFSSSTRLPVVQISSLSPLFLLPDIPDIESSCGGEK